MKFKTVFFFLLFFTLCSNAFSSVFLDRLKDKIKEKEKVISQLKEEVSSLEEKEKRLAKIYIMLQFKKTFGKNFKLFQTDESLIEKNYKDKFYDFLENWLFKKFKLLSEQEKKLQEEIEKKERELLSLKEFYIRAKRQPNTIILDPLSLKVIKPGRYRKRRSRFLKTVYSPINGKITFVEYGEEGINLVIENNKCKAKLWHLSKIKVNLGEKVMLGQNIGILKPLTRLEYEVNCD